MSIQLILFCIQHRWAIVNFIIGKILRIVLHSRAHPNMINLIQRLYLIARKYLKSLEIYVQIVRYNICNHVNLPFYMRSNLPSSLFLRCFFCFVHFNAKCMVPISQRTFLRFSFRSQFQFYLCSIMRIEYTIRIIY